MKELRPWLLALIALLVAASAPAAPRYNVLMIVLDDLND